MPPLPVAGGIRIARSRSLLVLVALALVPLAPSALAVHECDYHYYNALGVEATLCLDAQGRPHDVMVKDETLGGVMVNHPFFSSGHTFWGGDFQSISVVVWTYPATPTGRSWVHPFWWCEDYDRDGYCDFTWVGASTYARGQFNQAHVQRSAYDGQWHVCYFGTLAWRCDPVPVDLGPGVPVLPTLP